jgi:hypothetical protein
LGQMNVQMAKKAGPFLDGCNVSDPLARMVLQIIKKLLDLLLDIFERFYDGRQRTVE